MYLCAWVCVGVHTEKYILADLRKNDLCCVPQTFAVGLSRVFTSLPKRQLEYGSLKTIQIGAPCCRCYLGWRQLGACVTVPKANVTFWSPQEPLPKTWELPTNTCFPPHSTLPMFVCVNTTGLRKKSPNQQVSFFVYTVPESVGCFLPVVFKS